MCGMNEIFIKNNTEEFVLEISDPSRFDIGFYAFFLIDKNARTEFLFWKF